MGRTPLCTAAKNNKKDIVQIQLSNGAEPNSSDIIERTPLHWAVHLNHKEIVQTLLEQGADPNKKTSYYMNDLLHKGTPLHLAAYKGYKEIVQLLLDRGALPDLADSWGRTIFAESRHTGQHKEIIQLLHEHCRQKSGCSIL